ncbi:MAG: class I SAM-dependent methyltransferase [Candidatus Omnitrophica bacterium]|jgi:2-polyprenyl-3-methyl-5-hydroxy-6-metoxy-1,4-benzoquinol methylase|nr:class I SAM-dependent methyltransferase [Candidatus Omnitrophota bacterium]
MQNKSAINSFRIDIKENNGYRYTTNPSLSSRLSNAHLSDAAFKMADFAGKRVLDVGCGDATYTVELCQRGKALRVYGVDLAFEAISSARAKNSDTNINFALCSVDRLPFKDNAFDIVYMRGILHHICNPGQALKEALRVASEVIILDPNGYNPFLKIIERFSSYHRAHNEKSYPPFVIRRWVGLSAAKILKHDYIGLVPFFCPDWAANLLKKIEPLVERIFILNRLCCASYLCHVERKK